MERIKHAPVNKAWALNRETGDLSYDSACLINQTGNINSKNSNPGGITL
jgi:hypothetical protein